MRKPAFCICENKGTDQLRGNSIDRFYYVAAHIISIVEWKNKNTKRQNIVGISSLRQKKVFP